MSFTFDNLAAAVSNASAHSVGGSTPVKVKLTTGEIVEIVDVRLANGDLILSPTESSEATAILIEL